MIDVTVRYCASAAPLIVVESIYNEVDEIILHDFQNKSIECTILESEMYKLKEIKGVLDVDLS